MCCRTLIAACSRRLAPSLVVNLARASNRITNGGVACSSPVGTEVEARWCGPDSVEANHSKIVVRAETIRPQAART